MKYYIVKHYVILMSDSEMEIELWANRNKSKPLYYSNAEEQYIVNAVTGEKYPWKVGHLDEQRLFKVKDASLSGLKSNGRISQTAYYKDPYEYMIYNNVHLPNSIIERWKKRAIKNNIN